MQADETARSVRILKAENKELGQKQEELILENKLLIDKANRMNENLKKMKYNDAMVSKTNMSVNQLNRDISNIEGNLNKLNEEGKRTRQQLEERETALHKLNNSRNHDMQGDLKLKNAELQNKQLGDELRALNTRLQAALQLNVKGSKGYEGMDLLNDLSRIFDADRSMIMPVKLAGAGFDFQMDEGDIVKEYDFKVNIMEQELQSLQTDNSNLVQNILRLKHEARDKRNFSDELSKKLLVQQSACLKKDIQEADD